MAIPRTLKEISLNQYIMNAQQNDDFSPIDSTPTENLYVLVCWPWVQELMEYPWFRPECCLYQAFDDQEHLDSAYFVPLGRLREIGKPG
jgi:hypothetical protein